MIVTEMEMDSGSVMDSDWALALVDEPHVRKLERTNSGSPIETAITRYVLICVPECAVVSWIDRQRTIISPTIKSTGLTASARQKELFHLATDTPIGSPASRPA